MRAGEMDRLICIQRQQAVRDEYGGESVTWVDVAPRVWCRVRPLTAKERTKAPQLMAERVAVFGVRWRTDVSEDMRILFDGRAWNITGIAELGRREGLEIQAFALASEV